MSDPRHFTVLYRPGSRRALREAQAVTNQQLQDLDTLRSAAIVMVETLQQEVLGQRYAGGQSVGGDSPARALDRLGRTVRQCILLERRLLGLDPPPRERAAQDDAARDHNAAQREASAPDDTAPDARLAGERAEALDDDILDDFADLNSVEGLIADMDDEEIRSHGWTDRATALRLFATPSSPAPDPAPEPPAAAAAAPAPEPAPQPAKVSQKSPFTMDARELYANFTILAQQYAAARSKDERTRLQGELEPYIAAADRLGTTGPPRP